MHAIRKHHGAAHLTLLPTRPYDELARASGWFDEVWLAERPPWWHFGGLLSRRRQLRGGCFAGIHELQTSALRRAYYRTIGRPPPAWPGIQSGAPPPHPTADQPAMQHPARQH